MIKNAISIPLVILGYIYYLFRKKTPNFIYQSLVKSYCFTNGFIIIFLNFLTKFEKINLFFKNKNFQQNYKSIFKDIDYNRIDKILKKNGYYVFNEKLSEDIIDKILLFAKNNICIYFDDSGIKKNRFFKNDLENYDSSKYGYDRSDIYNSFIKDLIFDPVFTRISKNYLGTEPCLSNLDMWWSPARNRNLNLQKEIANQSAQMFHFDLDKIKFLKVFFYITDTDIYAGPHEYVEGSHKINSKPKELRNIGYDRLPDNLIRKHYSENKIKKILGNKGTVFIADTSCYHRGSPPLNNHRLLLVVEYASSLFGGNNTYINTNFNVRDINYDLIIKDKVRYL
jgi:hypothetical protein